MPFVIFVTTQRIEPGTPKTLDDLTYQSKVLLSSKKKLTTQNQGVKAAEGYKNTKG